MSTAAAGPLKTDPEYKQDGGWIVHLTIGPVSYEKRVAALCDWLKRNFKGSKDGCDGGDSWKQGGDGQHEKDFTIYLGSYVTMMSFVRHIENDPIVQQLDACNAGSADRIVGDTGKVGARFDPRGERAGRDWLLGWNGIPVSFADYRKVSSNKVLARAAERPRIAERPRAFLREMFGDYFLPAGIE